MAALCGYVLVLSLFVAALTCGMTVPVEAGPQFVLCQPSQDGAAVAQSEEGGHDFVHQCPCAICHGTEFDSGTATPAGADLGLAFARAQGTAPSFTPDRRPDLNPHRLGLARAPRAPPVASA